jgi:hypothetical protein
MLDLELKNFHPEMQMPRPERETLRPEVHILRPEHKNPDLFSGNPLFSGTSARIIASEPDTM